MVDSCEPKIMIVLWDLGPLTFRDPHYDIVLARAYGTLSTFTFYAVRLKRTLSFLSIAKSIDNGITSGP